MNTMNPKKNPLARRRRRRAPGAIYTGPVRLLNGNGSKYDPVAEDSRKGRRQ